MHIEKVLGQWKDSVDMVGTLFKQWLNRKNVRKIWINSIWYLHSVFQEGHRIIQIKKEKKT